MPQTSSIKSFSEVCPDCLKPLHLCVCAELQPVDTKTRVLILQHPQEPDKLLGTARIAHLSLRNSKLVIGLSWPNLKKAWGTETDPREWLALYLGSVQPAERGSGQLLCVDRKGAALPDSARCISKIKGIVVLDGTWSQAKTLWWRNAWLTKLQRAVLHPARPSLYGKLRKEPRRESLSTIETIALCLAELEHDEQLSQRLLEPFRSLLRKAGAQGAKPSSRKRRR